MFKTVKRIIDWCGEFKGKLYLGFVMTFFSHIFAAMPLGLAAYTVGLLIQSQQEGAPFDASWTWKSVLLQVVLVFFRFLFDYFRARLQEPISYQLTARDRLAVGDALKRVSLGYFQQKSTGSILSSITTGLSTLEGMGIRMIDNFVGGYLNFLVIFHCVGCVQPGDGTYCAGGGRPVPVLHAADLPLQQDPCTGGGAGEPGHDRGRYRVCQGSGCGEIFRQG